MTVVARKLKVGDVVDPGSGPTPRSLLHAFAELAEPEELIEVHSIGRWCIAQCQPNCEKVAVHSLFREGFEAWFPTYRHFKPVPLRKIASNMRHKHKDKVHVVIRPLFPGYVLLRRFAGGFDLSKLFELKGCLGLCVFDHGKGLPEPATISDAEVEMLRVRVAGHRDDRLDRVSSRDVLRSGILDDPLVRNPWPMKGRVSGRLDESAGVSLFIARGDRVVRVLRTPAQAKAMVTAPRQVPRNP